VWQSIGSFQPGEPEQAIVPAFLLMNGRVQDWPLKAGYKSGFGVSGGSQIFCPLSATGIA
jgi:hypothetical protein